MRGRSREPETLVLILWLTLALGCAAGTARPAEYNEDAQPFDELTFLQLPVLDRGRFGAWLNVAWDDQLAVNLLGISPHARVDALSETNCRLLRVTAVADVRLTPVGAALIVTSTSNLLDHLERFEADFSLPHGVRSRRAPEAVFSYWEIGEPVTSTNVERFLGVARQAGQRHFQFYHRAFAKSVGHFPWREEYPNGAADFRQVVDRLAEAGIVSGFHLHFSKAGTNDAYVLPVPDRRLRLRRHFTLAAPLEAAGTGVEVLENPVNATLDDGEDRLRLEASERRYLEFEGASAAEAEAAFAAARLE